MIKPLVITLNVGIECVLNFQINKKKKSKEFTTLIEILQSWCIQIASQKNKYKLECPNCLPCIILLN